MVYCLDRNIKMESKKGKKWEERERENKRSVWRGRGRKRQRRTSEIQCSMRIYYVNDPYSSDRNISSRYSQHKQLNFMNIFCFVGCFWWQWASPFAMYGLCSFVCSACLVYIWLNKNYSFLWCRWLFDSIRLQTVFAILIILSFQIVK